MPVLKESPDSSSAVLSHHLCANGTQLIQPGMQCRELNLLVRIVPKARPLSIPDVSVVDLYFVPQAEIAILILKRNPGRMMLLLIANVL